jgi:hypothetical protein
MDEEPEIIDLGWDEEEEAREEAERRRMLDRASKASGAVTNPETTAASPEAAATGNPRVTEAKAVQDSSIDDQDADYFVSDDAESNQDSVEHDELELGSAPGDEAGNVDAMEDQDAVEHHDSAEIFADEERRD